MNILTVSHLTHEPHEKYAVAKTSPHTHTPLHIHPTSRDDPTPELNRIHRG